MASIVSSKAGLRIFTLVLSDPFRFVTGKSATDSKLALDKWLQILQLDCDVRGRLRTMPVAGIGTGLPLVKPETGPLISQLFTIFYPHLTGAVAAFSILYQLLLQGSRFDKPP